MLDILSFSRASHLLFDGQNVTDAWNRAIASSRESFATRSMSAPCSSAKRNATAPAFLSVDRSAIGNTKIPRILASKIVLLCVNTVKRLTVTIREETIANWATWIRANGTPSDTWWLIVTPTSTSAVWSAAIAAIRPSRRGTIGPPSSQHHHPVSDYLIIRHFV